MNKGWLRYGLASMTLLGVGLAGFVVACGDDDSGKTVGSPDSGTQETSTPPPEEEKDAGDSGTTTPKPQPARLQLVNAASDFGPSLKSGLLRVCFAAGTTAANVTVTPLPALPEQSANAAIPPGIPIGIGGVVGATGLSLAGLFVQPYLMNAETLVKKGAIKPGPGTPSTSCSDLLSGAVDGGALVENADYWKLPVIPAQTLLDEKSYILVLTGCAGDSTAGAGKCGSDFTPGAPGLGNLKVTAFDVDRATKIDADKIGTQFIHASPAADAFLKGLPGGALQVVPGYLSDKNNPATFKGVSGGGGDAGVAVALGSKTDLVQVSGINVASDSFTANPNIPTLGVELPLIQAISYPTGVPQGGAYANGGAFTFIAVGDPTADADAGTGQFNTRKFHYLAFTNNPPIEVYKP